MQYNVHALILGLVVIGALRAQAQTTCGLDIMWALDTSCSIAVEDGEKVRDFIVKMIKDFNIGPGQDETQVGVVNFNKGTQHQFYLRDSTDDATAIELAENIDLSNLKYKNNSGCKTHTFRALDEIRNKYFTPKYGDRGNVPNVVIVVTDGVTVQPKYQPDTIANAKKLHEDKVGVVVVALPSQSGIDGTFEFFSVASNERNVFTIDKFDNLEKFILDISAAVCREVETTARPPTTPPRPTPGGGLCPRGFFNPGDKGSCQIVMNACPKNNPLCCGDCMLFTDPILAVPNRPMYITTRKRNTKCLCEACLKKKICVPRDLRREWEDARNQAGLPVE